MTTHYDTLGVSLGATTEQLRHAFVAAARRHHPDAGGDPAAMRAVNDAWEVLGDPARRRRYDREVGMAQPGSVPDARDNPNAQPDTDVDWLAGPPRDTSPLYFLPAGLFVSSVFTACIALVFDEPDVLVAAVFLFLMSCAAVAAVTMLAMRRSARAGRR